MSKYTSRAQEDLHRKVFNAKFLEYAAIFHLEMGDLSYDNIGIRFISHHSNSLWEMLTKMSKFPTNLFLLFTEAHTNDYSL